MLVHDAELFVNMQKNFFMKLLIVRRHCKTCCLNEARLMGGTPKMALAGENYFSIHGLDNSYGNLNATCTKKGGQQCLGKQKVLIC